MWPAGSNPFFLNINHCHGFKVLVYLQNPTEISYLIGSVLVSMRQGNFIGMLLENDICFRVAKAMLFVFRLQGQDRFIVDIRQYIVQRANNLENAYSISWVVPCPVSVTTRIIRFLVGDPYKPSFPTVPWKGDTPTFIELPVVPWFSESSDLFSCISWENSLLVLCRLLSCLSNLSKFSSPNKRMSSSKKRHLRSTKFSIIFVGCPRFQPFAASQHQPRCSTSHHGRIFWAGPQARGRTSWRFQPERIYFRLEIFHRGRIFKRYLKPPPSQLYILKSGGRCFLPDFILDASKKGKFIVGRTKLVCLTAFSKISLSFLCLSEQYHPVLYCLVAAESQLSLPSYPCIFGHL